MEPKVLNKLHDINGKLIICECGGEYIFEERVLLTEPPQFPYRCEKCGKRKIQRQNKTIYQM